MKIFCILFLLLLPFCIFGQEIQTVNWAENNIRISTKKDIKVLDHNDSILNCKSRNFTLTIRKEDYLIQKKKMDDYLGSVMKVMSYLITDSIRHQSKDFVDKSYCLAKKGEDWGIFFLIREELNGDNLFLGFLSTTFKPSADHLKLVENIEVVEEGVEE
jgi:hypothetical protein